MTATRILAIDDEFTSREIVSGILAGAGFEVEVAEGGSEGQERIRARTPDLVVCDVNMPKMDGFSLLESVRTDSSTAALPFILLTARNDGPSVRRGMLLGADDFLTKPVSAEDLVQSVSGALDRHRRLSNIVSRNALPKQNELRDLYQQRIEGDEPAIPAEVVALGTTGRVVTQTVLFSDIRGFTTISERLPVAEVAEFLSQYMREACEPIVRNGGRITKLMGDAIMAVFGSQEPEKVGTHAAAALRAGLQMVEVARAFRDQTEDRFRNLGLPGFDIGIGIHTGPIMLFHMSAGGIDDLTAVGDTVKVAARLETKSKEMGWPLVASMATVENAGPEFVVAETREVELAGRKAPVVVARLGTRGAVVPRSSAQSGLSAGVEALLDENALATAVAAKEALDQTLHAIDGRLQERRATHQQVPVVRGYQVLSKLGEGGMSDVYLTLDESNRRQAVLKVLKGRRADDEGLWQRFFQECVILSSIRHNNVVRLYDYGFGDELAYIVMEYLNGGNLRKIIDAGLSRRQALALLSQAAGALAEVHERGIVHRDLKPDNLLLREGGVLVLTDFGIAKRLQQLSAQTQHGEILGTPYYLSPEQAQGSGVTPSADLYSLGVIFYEMLTGKRPFRGGTVQEILAQHMMASVPRLPDELADYQHLVDGMLAKNPAERFTDAGSLLDAIDELWTRNLGTRQQSFT